MPTMSKRLFNHFGGRSAVSARCGISGGLINVNHWRTRMRFHAEGRRTPGVERASSCRSRGFYFLILAIRSGGKDQRVLGRPEDQQSHSSFTEAACSRLLPIEFVGSGSPPLKCSRHLCAQGQRLPAWSKALRDRWRPLGARLRHRSLVPTFVILLQRLSFRSRTLREAYDRGF